MLRNVLGKNISDFVVMLLLLIFSALKSSTVSNIFNFGDDNILVIKKSTST